MLNKICWVEMSFLIWLFVAFRIADATQLLEKDSLPKSDLSLTRPEVVADFKNLLHKALEPSGAHHKDLLIKSGIIPAPSGYRNSKDKENDDPLSTTLSHDMIEHFNKHIKDILASLEKLDHALNVLYGDRLFQSSEHLKEIEKLKSGKSVNMAEVDTDASSEGADRKSEMSFIDSSCNSEGNSAVCKAHSSQIEESPKISSESREIPEGEFVTSSVVDTITSEYIKLFSSEIPESTTTQSSMEETSTSGEIKGVTSLTPLDDEFIMDVMSSSIPLSENELNSNTDTSMTDSENITPHAAEFASTDPSKNLEISEVEPKSIYSSHAHNRVLTFEEVKLLDQSLSPKPQLKYEVISTPKPNQDALSDIHFLSPEENSSSKPISKKRRRMNPRDISLDEPIFYQAPTPEKMLLRYYRDIPDTSFTCENKSQPGFYADQEADCQVFHVCWPGRRESFLCPVGSLFNQQVLSCDNFNNTNCSLSHAYFDVNVAFQEYDDAKAHNVTPSPDPMMKPIENDSGSTKVVATKADIVELFEADIHFSEMITNINIAELWDYVPVKAKVFVYPEPSDLKKFLDEHQHSKVRKSKDVRQQQSNAELEDSTAGEEVLDDIEEKRQRIESNIIRVLKKLSRKHRD